MAVEKLTTDSQSGVTEQFHYDHTDNAVTVTQAQDDAPIREYIAQQRLAGAKYVEGMGYEIATLPVALCELYGTQRGLPQNWYYRPEYNDEMRKLIALASDFNPHGKSM
jgi:hypothetical protein